MGRMNTVLLTVLVASFSTLLTAQNVTERQALGRQIAQRFEVLPVQGGIVLKPKVATRDAPSTD